MDEYDESAGKEYLGLTLEQRKLLWGDISYESEEQLETIIEKKVQRLPKRLKALFTDIDALDQANFFESDWEPPVSDTIRKNNQEKWKSYEWEPILREVLDDDGIVSITEGTIKELEPSPDGELKQSIKNDRAENFGESLGIAIHQLTQDSMANEAQHKLLAGFFYGLLMGKEGRSDFVETDQRFSSALEEIEDSSGMHRLSIQPDDTIRPQKKVRKQLDENMAKDIITNVDLTPSDTLVGYIIDNSFDITRGKYRRERNHRTIDTTTDVSLEEPTWETPIPLYPEMSFEQRKLLRGDIIVRLAKRNKNLGSIDKLRNQINTAIGCIEDLQERSRVFTKIYNDSKSQEGGPNISKVNDYFDEGGGMNGRILKMFAGEYFPFNGTPLITDDRASEITPLGDIVGYLLVEKNNNLRVIELLHKYALDMNISDREEDIIETALAAM